GGEGVLVLAELQVHDRGVGHALAQPLPALAAVERDVDADLGADEDAAGGEGRQRPRVDDHAVGVDVGQVAADVHPVQAAVDGVAQGAAAGAPDRHVGVHRVGGRHGEALDRVGGAAGQAGAAVGEAVGPAVQVHEDLALVGAGVNAGQARRDVGGEGQGRHALLRLGGLYRV